MARLGVKVPLSSTPAVKFIGKCYCTASKWDYARSKNITSKGVGMERLSNVTLVVGNT